MGGAGEQDGGDLVEELRVRLTVVETALSDLDSQIADTRGDIAKAEKEIKGLAGRLANPNFADKAPPEVVAVGPNRPGSAASRAAWSTVPDRSASS